MSNYEFGERKSLAPATHAQAIRRRLFVGGAAATLAVGLGLGANQAVSAFEHAGDPIPAGCDVQLRQGQTVWDIASAIADHERHQDTGDVSYAIGRANPGMDFGHVEPGEPVGVPEEYCGIVAEYHIGQ